METLVERYLATWNETDSDRRTTLLRETFAEEATYHDPLMAASGHAAIDGLVRAVQARFPCFVFRLSGTVETVGDHVRFSWTLGPVGGPPAAGGTDFARVEAGRFACVVGFLDRVEAP